VGALAEGLRQSIAKGAAATAKRVPIQIRRPPMAIAVAAPVVRRQETSARDERGAGRFTGEFPTAAEIDQAMQSRQRSKDVPFTRVGAHRPLALPAVPRAHRPKDTLRIAVEREVEMGGVARAGAGYLHPQCAGEFVKDEKLAEQLKQNSSGLKPRSQTSCYRNCKRSSVGPPAVAGPAKTVMAETPSRQTLLQLFYVRATIRRARSRPHVDGEAAHERKNAVLLPQEEHGAAWCRGCRSRDTRRCARPRPGHSPGRKRRGRSS